MIEIKKFAIKTTCKVFDIGEVIVTPFPDKYYYTCNCMVHV